MMTAREAAEKLDACEYGDEGSPELFAAMKDAGLVAVFGASDDLMEFRGAIDDELGAYEGTTAHLNTAGLLKNECSDEDCPYFATAKKNASTIEAKWADDDGISWTYTTEIPHFTFTVMEDGETYCRGIVFKLADA